MKNLNRRHWLKTSLFGLAGLSAIPEVLAHSNTSLDSKVLKSTGSLREIPLPFNADVPMKARLLANENPFGPSEKALKAIASSISEGNRYGHADAHYLIQMIAEKEGVSPEHIMLGPGSTDLLEKTAIALCRHGGNVISADPSYLSLVNTAQAVGASWKAIPLTEDHSHDLNAILKSIDKETKLIYVCNPNNPMGSITDFENVKSFCKNASQQTPVFVDEAYLDFLENAEEKSAVNLVAEGYDVIVARTFSKIHGMAGLRIGYIVATPERIKSVTDMVRSTMGLSITSLKGAIASFKDESFIAECRQLNRESRDFTSQSIKSLGYQEIPSHTSFMIFPIRSEAKPFARSMIDQGVGIRMYAIDNKPWCRVSMGTMQEMNYFVEALKVSEA
ncbi:MAG: aminotransferase class I/II-fold pyridoxal phosphate-dependent enzyme [Mongoliibacter sp.]|uniref:pyridoxal phosphate-dependent aminotransferase n=1 Tax=Mongoliibacter sp. TaxID=2022438 RepID=UPI0012F14BF4|nr:aminotransferase class I/II-fold pyridoxal phosphate-dependent enzyme [Mongoliibacter sp.]TVP44212.1 MAG: aminotransferase class I/II-fold pyridoxal phosphate-dependent enzyme [Mongoliibacter sp.]